jgi:tRNA pseudouridine38-40 synthase
MVRRLVGVIVEVGRRGLSADEAVAMLSTDSELPARLTAPASGLFLEQVRYDGDSTPRRSIGVGGHLLWTVPDVDSS